MHACQFEDFYTYKVTFDFSSKISLEDIFSSSLFISDLAGVNINYELYIDGEISFESQCLHEYKKQCFDSVDDEDCCKVSLVIDKSNSPGFVIIEKNVFSDYLMAKNYIDSATLFFSEVMNHEYKLFIRDGNILKLVELERPRPMKPTPTMVSKSALLFEFFSCGGDPDLMFDWSRMFDDRFRNYLKEVSSLLMLSHLCSDFDVVRKCFVFSGYKEVEIFFDNVLNGEEQQDILQTVYQWVYSGQEDAVKLGILSNVISLFSASADTSLFDQNLKRTLFSNYKIYLKGNIERYIEVKNKVSEFVFDLSNKIIEHTDNFRGEVKKSVFAVYSFFFMSVVFTGIDKGKLSNIFNFEVSILTMLFLVAAIFYIHVSKSELNRKIDFAEEQLSDLKFRYSTVLDLAELEEVFQRNIVSQVRLKFNEDGIYFFGLVLCFSLIFFVFVGLLLNIGLEVFVGRVLSLSSDLFY
ncbi:hypothetical protein HGO26_00720 [Shewanella sp. S-1]|uniref:Uncharacterized protein n=1 Tax=Shewanella oncorhynchi TaxID=2726434 RepID=A0ABX1KGU4_9GAMM|nr:hypothetical protein [Shewanella oncorhynchi]NLQ21412.1 hypothetical protein [Shewanella oncorhynchi]